jgi:hypothetical protein
VKSGGGAEIFMLVLLIGRNSYLCFRGSRLDQAIYCADTDFWH